MDTRKLRKTARQTLAATVIVVSTAWTARAHDVTTKVTWNREISRIVYARCAACHRPGGSAFSLMDYQEAAPWAAAIKETVLRRQMPPWGAVKGFGTFRNDQALSQEEIDLITNWVAGGAPEGNPDHLPTRPRISLVQTAAPRPGEIIAGRGFVFERPFAIDGFRVLDYPKGASAQLTIAFPDGRIEPLVWLYGDTAARDHPFLLRAPLHVPAGASLRGLPAGWRLALLPVTPPRASVPH